MSKTFYRRSAGFLVAVVALTLALTCFVAIPGYAVGEGGLDRGLLYLQMDLPELALQEFDKAAGTAAVDTLVLQGLLLEALGRPEKAAAAYAAASKTASHGPGVVTSAVIKTFSARAAEKQGRLDEAADLYREALSADATLGLARLGLADVLEQQGQVEEAISEYRRFLAANPNDADALASLGRLYLQTGKTSEARETLEAALHLDPGLEEAADALHKLKP